MKVRLFVLFIVLGMIAALKAVAVDEPAAAFAPPERGIQRYEAIWKRSPFIVETVAVQTTEGLASKYAVVGIASISKEFVVFLVDKNNAGDPVKGRVMVKKGRPTPDGIELVSVSLDRDPRKSSVVLKQGTQQATLSYDQAQLNQFGPGGGGAASGGVPPAPMGIIPSSNGIVPPPPARPRIMRPGIPNGETQAVPSSPATPPMAPTAPSASRRIIRPAIDVDN